eukprot:3756756-Amphidinium_carterae.1
MKLLVHIKTNFPSVGHASSEHQQHLPWLNATEWQWIRMAMSVCHLHSSSSHTGEASERRSLTWRFGRLHKREGTGPLLIFNFHQKRSSMVVRIVVNDQSSMKQTMQTDTKH